MLHLRPVTLCIALTAATCLSFAAVADELSGAEAFHNKLFAMDREQNSADVPTSAAPVRSGMDNFHAALVRSGEPVEAMTATSAK